MLNQVFADEKLPRKVAVSINGISTDAEIYLSATVANGNHYKVPHANISLPRSFQIEAVIRPEKTDIITLKTNVRRKVLILVLI